MDDRARTIPLIRTTGRPSAERRALQRRVRRGELTAVRPGVLVVPSMLVGLRPEDHLLLLVRATAPMIRAPRAFARSAAAAVHGLPFVHAPPKKLDVVDPRRARADTTAHLRLHPSPPPRATASASRWAGLPATAPTDIDGAPVTSLARTLVDIASSCTLELAVPMIDHAMRDRRLLPEVLADEFAAVDPPGHDKAGIAVGMGSALSGSPAESVCRVRFRELGVPEPVQQHVFARPGSGSAVVDFWFPEHGVVVEVDGRGKYEDPGMLAGRSTADAHWREKRREDFIRSFPGVRAVVRLSWSDLMHPDRVRAALRRAGVPCR
jgi:hypothetical protein